MMDVKPVVLTGKYVRLEPLTEEHAAGLTEIGLDDTIWEYLPYGGMQNESDIRRWVRTILDRICRH